MYELIQAGERTWYFEAPTKVGAYVEADGSVILIDSGNDKDAGNPKANNRTGLVS